MLKKVAWMAATLLGLSTLYSVEALVMLVLSFLVLLFYRDSGVTFIKLLTISLFFLATSLVGLAIQSWLGIVSLASSQYLLVSFLIVASKYLHLLFLLFAIYIARSRNRVGFKWLVLSSAFIVLLSAFSVIAYATDSTALYSRFYLRESLVSLIYGCSFLFVGISLWMIRTAFFTRRVMITLAAWFTLRYLLFAFGSVIVLATDWFRSILLVLPYLDAGGHMVLGFIVLIWLQEAERYQTDHVKNKAKYLDKHDSLTGALNREQVMEKLPLAMEQARDNGSELALFLIDIKHFKFLNNTYGLKAGDQVLGEVATRLRQSILMPNIVGRLSGDSFIYAVEVYQQEQLKVVETHLHEVISRAYQIGQESILIQATTGYATFPTHGDVAEDLLQKANIALHQAEVTNISGLAYQPGMEAQSQELLAREKELKQAMQNHQLVLHFQPQLNLYTNRLEGVEALVRWQHPENGLLFPGDFLDDIEKLGLSSELDNYVLDMACQQIAAWYQEYQRRVTVAVNLTAVEFQDPKLIATIQSLLFKYEIPPKCLELEITENVVITDIATVMDTIVVLQNMGISVSIDDFGTGYSSLAYLRELPIDKIKIDRSFIKDVANNDSDITIVKSMIKLSHGLGKRVLAEGVEDESQLSILKSLGCDAVQGYFIAKPMPTEALAKYLERK